MRQNWRTTVFGAIAALGVWAHSAGVLDGTKYAQPAAIVTAAAMAMAGLSAKDFHSADYLKQTVEDKATVVTTEKL